MYLTPRIVAEDLLRWVREDAPQGDCTTWAVEVPDAVVRAVVIAKSRCVAACTGLLAEALQVLGFRAKALVRDGEWVKPGTHVLEVIGDAREVLLFERTILNLLLYTYSVATTTRLMVETVKGSGVRVAATRKTPPGLRFYAKCAVAQAGGDTHRLTLSDAVLIKDNHIAVVGGVGRAVRYAKRRATFTHKVEVEVSNLEDALEAARAGADILLLDNMSPEEVRAVVRKLEEEGLRGKVVVEASGGITLENARAYAESGVDVISSSKLTMTPVHVDLSLRIVEVVGLRSA